MKGGAGMEILKVTESKGRKDHYFYVASEEGGLCEEACGSSCGCPWAEIKWIGQGGQWYIQVWGAE